MTATTARYRVTAFAISLAALAYVQRVAISQAAGNIQADLHLDKAQLGLVFGAFGLAYALFEIPSGLMGDRFGVRVTLTRIVRRMVRLHSAERCGVEFQLTLGVALPLRCR